MVFTIDDIRIKLTQENEVIRLTTNDDNVLLQNQTMDSVKGIVIDNFHVVKSYYEVKAGNSIDKGDLSIISLKIALHYLYMYNMWRMIYMNLEGRDLKFITNDFQHPFTHDMVISYFRNKYPDNYSTKCELILGMSDDKFRKYEKGHQEFHDMW